MSKYYKLRDKLVEETKDAFFGKGIITRVTKNKIENIIGNTSIYHGRPSGLKEISKAMYKYECKKLLEAHMKLTIAKEYARIDKMKDSYARQINSL